MVKRYSKKTRKTRRIRKSKKISKISQVTALIPKTVKATKNVTLKVIKTGYSIFNTTKKSLKNLSRGIDKHTAKTIHSLYKRR
jgi:hypothetical protein